MSSEMSDGVEPRAPMAVTEDLTEWSDAVLVVAVSRYREEALAEAYSCLLYTSPSPRDS